MHGVKIVNLKMFPPIHPCFFAVHQQHRFALRIPAIWMAHADIAAQTKLEIVPRKSIPIVGGGMWTAIDLFLGFILGPILGTMSIPSRIELTKRLMPKMVILMPMLVVMTLAGGFQLARHQGFILSSDKHHGWDHRRFAIWCSVASKYGLVVANPKFCLEVFLQGCEVDFPR